MKEFTGADYLTMPWKSGGVTTQLAIEPPTADLSNFDWRISTAQVAGAGPFSLFAGIDRSLAVLQGSGLGLNCGGQYTSILRSGSKRWAHELETMQLLGLLRCARNADLMFIYCAHGAAVRCCNTAGAEADCLAGEPLLINATDGDHIKLIATAPATLYVARLMVKGNQDD